MKPMSGKRSATPSQDPDSPVLYDGWPLVYAPASPAALHLLELIEALPVEFSACLALPGELNPAVAAEIHAPRSNGPSGERRPAPDIALQLSPNTPTGRIHWEQRILPSIAGKVGARALHTTSLYPPLACPVPVVVSPVEDFQPRREREAGLARRLRASLGRGGMSQVSAVLWPADFPAPSQAMAVFKVAAHTHSAFRVAQPRPDGLPEQYLYAPAPLDSAGMELLAAAWSWVSAGLGEEWVLLAGNLSERELEHLRALSREAGASGPVESVAPVSPAEQSAVFQYAGAALIVASPRPWADAFLHALVCACPVIAEETRPADARIGPAGYLTPPGDARAFGAAALTVVVEEEVSAQLARSAQERINTWRSETFSDSLAAVYKALEEPAISRA